MKANASCSMPLPPSVLGGMKDLSAEARKHITQLSKPAPVKFIGLIASAWLVIIVTIGVAVYLNNIFVTLLAIIIVAAQQNRLALLMHEQTHYLGLKSRWGDLITDLFVCYPLLILSVRNYSRIHLAHHKFFFTEQDPDLARKSGEHWTFPMRPSKLLLLFLRDFTGLSIIQTIRSKNKKAGIVDVKRLGPSHAYLKPVYLFVWAVLFTATHSWSIFLLYWLLPLLTVFQAFIRLGAIFEHMYIPDHPLETTTTIVIPSWWERVIFPYLNFFYHIYHHYFPGVPCSHLPEVHAIFVKEGLVDEKHVFNSIIKYLRFLLSHQHQAQHEAGKCS